MIREPLYGFPMSDIEYTIESVKQIALDKLYITQLLPTRYSINITEPLYGFPTLDIEYPIESVRRIALDKLYITQLLPTRYSINITNAFGGRQYNKQQGTPRFASAVRGLRSCSRLVSGTK